MVMHPRDARMLNDLHRREIRDFVTQQRLAALACDRPRGAGRRSKRLPRIADVVPVPFAAVRPHPRPRVGSPA